MEPKVVVITEASSGMGATVARDLSSKGHRTILAARRKRMIDCGRRDLNKVEVALPSSDSLNCLVASCRALQITLI